MYSIPEESTSTIDHHAIQVNKPIFEMYEASCKSYTERKTVNGEFSTDYSIERHPEGVCEG